MLIEKKSLTGFYTAYYSDIQLALNSIPLIMFYFATFLFAILSKKKPKQIYLFYMLRKEQQSGCNLCSIISLNCKHRSITNNISSLQGFLKNIWDLSQEKNSYWTSANLGSSSFAIYIYFFLYFLYLVFSMVCIITSTSLQEERLRRSHQCCYIKCNNSLHESIVLKYLETPL